MTTPPGVIATDAVVVGAGPCGLFAVFQLGLVAIKCHVIDASDGPGGQCSALYPDKPIYDIPGFTRISGSELTERLLAQIVPFQTAFHQRQRVVSITSRGGGFSVTTHSELVFHCRLVVIAAGAGTFAAKMSENRADLANTPPPVRDWGVALHDDLIAVDPATFETSVPGLFAIGDVATYPGKLKIILSGFHEAALLAQQAFHLLNPHNRLSQQYTSASTNLQKKLGVL